MNIFKRIKRSRELQSVDSSVKNIKASMPKDVVTAHGHSTFNREEINNSIECACFFCLKTFKPQEIKEWIEESDTALCPKCGVDSVLGDKSGFPLTTEFLEAMHKSWFSEPNK